jgi:hypothetical protein
MIRQIALTAPAPGENNLIVFKLRLHQEEAVFDLKAGSDVPAFDRDLKLL